MEGYLLWPEVKIEVGMSRTLLSCTTNYCIKHTLVFTMCMRVPPFGVMLHCHQSEQKKIKETAFDMAMNTNPIYSH